MYVNIIFRILLVNKVFYIKSIFICFVFTVCLIPNTLFYAINLLALSVVSDSSAAVFMRFKIVNFRSGLSSMSS